MATNNPVRNRGVPDISRIVGTLRVGDIVASATMRPTRTGAVALTCSSMRTRTYTVAGTAVGVDKAHIVTRPFELEFTCP